MPHQKRRSLSVLSVVLMLVCAHGANQALAADEAGEAATPAVPATAESAEGLWDRANLLDDWGGWRSQAEAAGITPFANLTENILGNVRGGVRDGMTQEMWLNAGFDADLQKLAGWEGATLHASFNWVQGQDLDSNTGSFNETNGNDAANQVRLYNLYVQDKLFDNQLTIKVGQIGMDEDFFLCDDMALFLNQGLGGPPAVNGQASANGDGSLPSYPVDSPGVFVRYDPAGQPYYLMLGDYLSDAGPDVSNNHGFDWRISNGMAVIGEAGWHYTLAGHDGTLLGGAYYDQGQFTNWDTGLPQRGIYGFYGAIEQVFLENSGKAGEKAQPILSGYVAADWAGPDARVAPNGDFSAGLNWNGPISSRPNDVAGLAILYTNFSPDYTRSAFNPNGAGVSTAAETVVEATYAMQVAPWFHLQPDVQVIFNPANAKTRATAVVIGTQAVIAF